MESPLIINDGITTQTIYYESAEQGLKQLSTNSVHLMVTSPPYANLKDYGHPDQIGFGQTLFQYRQSLRNIFHECYRVLQEGRRMIINIGDLVISNKDASDSTHRGNFYREPLHAYVIEDMMACGFKYLGEILWWKTGTHNPQNNGSPNILGSYPYPPNAHISAKFEYILLFRKREEPQKKNPRPHDEILSRSKLTKQQWEKYTNPIWHFQGDHVEGHPAPFPIELPYRCIALWSFWGETICDPFIGTGSTAQASKMLGRNCIGFEINPAYKDLQKHRIQQNRSLLSFNGFQKGKKETSGI